MALILLWTFFLENKKRYVLMLEPYCLLRNFLLVTTLNIYACSFTNIASLLCCQHLPFEHLTSLLIGGWGKVHPPIQLFQLSFSPVPYAASSLSLGRWENKIAISVFFPSSWFFSLKTKSMVIFLFMLLKKKKKKKNHIPWIIMSSSAMVSLGRLEVILLSVHVFQNGHHNLLWW